MKETKKTDLLNSFLNTVATESVNAGSNHVCAEYGEGGYGEEGTVVLCVKCGKRVEPKVEASPVPLHRSWAAEVIADDSGKWCGNGLRFKTEKEALDYAFDLSCRWTAVRETRAVPSEEEPNR